MWYQGLGAAPDMIRRIDDIWRHLHSAYERVQITGEEADDLVASEGIDPHPLTIQMRADLVRVKLLAEGGGIWADATILPSTPLDSWLGARLDVAGFFAHSTPGSDRIIDNWFLAARRGNQLVQAWKDACMDYFRTPRRPYSEASAWERAKREIRRSLAPTSFASARVARRAAYYPYHIQSYLLAHLVRTDPATARIWRRVPKLDGRSALRLKTACANPDSNLSVEQLRVLLHRHPLHKLNWRHAELFSKVLDLAEAELATH